MTKPQEFITDYKKEVEKYNNILKGSIEDKKTAQKWFTKQVNCVKAIRNSEWYKEIKNYFTRVLIADQDIIMQATMLWWEKFKEQAFTAAVEMKLATQFLNFLDNLETAEDYSDDATIEDE